MALTTETKDVELPKWQEFIIYVLRALNDGAVLHRGELENRIIEASKLTKDQLSLTLPTGGSHALNRMGWAISALVRAGAIERPKGRGYYTITEIGRGLLNRFPNGIQKKDLITLSAWNEYTPTFSRNKIQETLNNEFDENDPTEAIELSVERVKSDVAGELLTRLRSGEPEFFEKSVIALLRAMKYGSGNEGVEHIGGTGDGGVDGVINQDALGLHRVFIQAKRYAEGNTVGRQALQAFVGALADKGANQGAFVTTSTFTKEAIQYAEKVSAQTRIVLIDGSRLAELMIQHRVGVQVKETYELIEIDEDFFD